MKQYIVFKFMSYYPSGGWYDLAPESYDTLAEAIKATTDTAENVQIVDIRTGTLVAEGWDDIGRYGKFKWRNNETTYS